ncbi:MAG TPA: acyl-CoA thioesterase [Chitinophagaceae bacterium]
MQPTFYTIRFNDCDPFGHLNNSKYIDYMLNAREDHLRHYHQLDLDTFYKQGIGWVVSNHEIRYVRPASYNETVCIESDLIDAGDSSLLVEMRMLNESRTSLKALLWSTFTCVNIRTGKKENHSQDFMEKANQLLVPGIFTNDGLKMRVVGLTAKSKVGQ